MAMEDYEQWERPERRIVHVITEQEKNAYADKKIEQFFWGSRKQWRTVMMIEVNTHRKFLGTTYGELHNFIAMYIDEAIEVSKKVQRPEPVYPSMGGDWYDSEDCYLDAMASSYYDGI